jgi:HlyD family secretion protein
VGPFDTFSFRGAAMKNRVLFGVALLTVAGVCVADDARPGGRFRQEAVRRGSLRVVVEATGTVEPAEVVDVGAQVPGRVLRFGPDPNDRNKSVDYRTEVKRDSVLAQLDPTPYEAEVGKARAGLVRAEAGVRLAKAKAALAERELRRAQRRRADKAADASEVEVAQAALEVARGAVPVEEAAVAEKQAALRQAQQNLEYTTLRSPIDGVVIDRRCNVGQVVTPNLSAASLFLIAKDLRKMQVWAAVKETDIGRVTKGQTALFTVDAYPNETFKGRVAQIRLNAMSDKHVVTYTVVVDADNAPAANDPDELKLKPYLTANLQFQAGQRKDVLLVPNAALRWRPQPQQVAATDRAAYERWLVGGGPVVWVEEMGFVRLVRLKTGPTDGTRTEVVGGDLPEGTKVVTGMAPESSSNSKK